jgi:hypothetical protein
MFITLVPLAILDVINYQNLKTQVTDDVELRLSGLSRRVAKAIDIVMDQRIADVSGWTGLETVQTALDLGSGQGGANKLFDSYAKSYGTFDAIMLLNKKGTAITVSPRDRGFHGRPKWLRIPWKAKNMVENGVSTLLEQLVHVQRLVGVIASP